MNKTAIKNFSIWARNKLIDDIRYRAGLLGITEEGIQSALPQSAGDTEFYDIGTAQPYSISGEAVRQRQKLVEAVRRKEREGSYQTAYQYIVEEVAYTWFNRLIAIRFMEVNDYLPSHVRVLSSDFGKLEPDLVTTPFAAELVFSEAEEQAVLRLKQDSQIDELFRLLFIKQCNALNEILPGLFEKTSDYTELLLSVSVIDRDGVVYRLTHDIAEDDFNIEKGGQVEIIGWLYQYWNTEPKDAVFGRPSGQKIKKEEIPAATQLFTPDWIVRYMVENSLGRLWVEGHTPPPPDGGSPPLSGEAGSDTQPKASPERGGAEHSEAEGFGWNYYLEEAEQEPAVRAQLAEIRRGYAALTPEDIKCIDPCMGSGHILCYLFDVLMQIYESQGYSRRDAAQSIVRHNLYGLDIDKRATQLAYFSVMMKARQYDRRFFSRNLQPMVYCTAWDEDGENFGSLVMVDDPGERPADPRTVFELADYEKRLNVWNYRYLLAQKYHVVCTNPPYMAVSNGNGQLQDYVKKNFPDSKADLFAVFMERCGQLTGKNGYQAMITQHAWMFLSSFEKLRAKLRAVDTVNMVHLGPRAFEEIGGEVVQTTSFVIRKSHTKDYKGTYCRLIEPTTQQGKEDMFLAGENRYTAQQDNFSKIPGAPVAYWLTAKFIELLSQEKTIGKSKESGSGLSTADNERFLRFFWEVNQRKIALFKNDMKKWFFFQKGGEYRKWYGNLWYVVNWADDGAEIKHWVTHNPKDPNTTSWSRRIFNTHLYFQRGITWSVISSGDISFRATDENAMISNAAGGIFGFSDENQRDTFMAAINSKVWTLLFSTINPTLNYSSGVIQKAPLPILPKTDLGSKCVALSRTDWDSFETSWDFKRHPLV